MVSFSLASDAVRCAIAIQKASKAQEILLKIGIHEGEIVWKEADMLGDAVNIASRLQQAAEEGGISISSSVYREIKNKAEFSTEFTGEQSFKNVEEPVKVYKILVDTEESSNLPISSTQPASKRNKRLFYILGGV